MADDSGQPGVSSQSAYVQALALLARRELSEAQVRTRLARKGFATDAVDVAVERLKHERALNDRRVADAIARTEVATKRRGRLRVRRRIEQAGISPSIARAATDAAMADVDPGTHIESALRKRLRGRDAIADDREFQRLYRFLVAQGFESEQVLAVLTPLRPRGSR